MLKTSDLKKDGRRTDHRVVEESNLNSVLNSGIQRVLLKP